MFKHIMIPTDGSELSEKAIDAGVEFAREVKARVTGFIAVPEYKLPSEGELMARHGVTPSQHEAKVGRLADEALQKDLERRLAAGRHSLMLLQVMDRPADFSPSALAAMKNAKR